MLKIDKLTKAFNKQLVFKDLSFTVNKGEIVCLMGKSGAGKTTALRCMNQLETIDGGTITLDDLVIDNTNKYNLLMQRSIGLVFQSWNLFSHMTILENCTNAAIYHKLLTKDTARAKALSLLDMMGIKDKAYCYPDELSGGQKQRAAIVRACMLNPKILCFDEPTSALDLESTLQVASLIKQLSNEDIGILVVTHDDRLAKELNAKVVTIQ